MTVTGYLKDKILYISLSGEMDECSAHAARSPITAPTIIQSQSFKAFTYLSTSMI